MTSSSNSISKRLHLSLAAALTLAISSACGGTSAAVEAPRNLMLVVFDTTRADHLSIYGHPELTSPTVDALARRGARFDRAFSQSSLTPVSAGSFLTGTLPNRHGIRSLMSVGEQSLAADVETLAERLALIGMQTAAFVSARPMGAHYGLDRGFDTFSDDVGRAKRQVPCGNEYQRRADETTELALDWLGSNALDPFALMVHFFDAHDANLVPPRDFLAEHVSFALPGNVNTPCALMGLTKKFKLELYDAEIAWMDLQLNRLLQRLKRIGVLDETLVCIIADHGEGLDQHGDWTHGWLYREQLRVPLVMAGPGIPEGTVIEETVQLIDLFPTLSELFGMPIREADISGISLLPLLDGKSQSERAVYAEVHHDLNDFLGRDPAMFSLERDGWKYIHRPESGEHELYNTAVDAGEVKNLYAQDHSRAVRLLAELRALGVLGGGLFDRRDLPDEEQAALEALGYVGPSHDSPETPVDAQD